MRVILSICLCVQILGISAQDLSTAKLLFELKRYQDVIEHLEGLEIRDVDDLMLQGDAHHKLRQYDDALLLYDRVVALSPNHPKGLMRLGAVYLERGEFTAALWNVKKALKLAPDDAEVYFHMGNICYDQGDMRNSAKYYKQSLEKKPDYAKAKYMLGAVRSQQGDWQQAAEHFTGVMGSLPDAMYNLAVVNLESGNYHDAIDYFTRLSISGWESSADLFFFRAEAFVMKGDKRSACLDYKNASRLGDEEAAEIYDSYCLKSQKKAKRKRRDVVHMDL